MSLPLWNESGSFALDPRLAAISLPAVISLPTGSIPPEPIESQHQTTFFQFGWGEYEHAPRQEPYGQSVQAPYAGTLVSSTSAPPFTMPTNSQVDALLDATAHSSRIYNPSLSDVNFTFNRCDYDTIFTSIQTISGFSGQSSTRTSWGDISTLNNLSLSELSSLASTHQSDATATGSLKRKACDYNESQGGPVAHNGETDTDEEWKPLHHLELKAKSKGKGSKPTSSRARPEPRHRYREQTRPQKHRGESHSPSLSDCVGELDGASNFLEYMRAIENSKYTKSIGKKHIKITKCYCCGKEAQRVSRHLFESDSHGAFQSYFDLLESGDPKHEHMLSGRQLVLFFYFFIVWNWSELSFSSRVALIREKEAFLQAFPSPISPGAELLTRFQYPLLGDALEQWARGYTTENNMRRVSKDSYGGGSVWYVRGDSHERAQRNTNLISSEISSMTENPYDASSPSRKRARLE